MRRIGLFFVVGVVLPLVATASAWAQGAVLQVTPQVAAPGDVVTVTGSAYNQSTTIIGGVDIRFDTRDGESVANTTVGSSGRFTIEFPVPGPARVAPGEHLLIGTQVSSTGRHVFGVPGRGRLTVTGPRAAAASAAPPGRSVIQATTALGAGVIALILLAGGTLAVGRLRTLNRPLGS